MQMYSTEQSLRGTQRDRMRKLSALIQPSHGTIHRLPSRCSRVQAGAAGLVLLALACSPVRKAEMPQPRPSTELIDPGSLARDLAVIAADSMQGRETGTPGAMQAARFIAARLSAFGLEPVGDSMFLQRVPLVRQTL